MESDFYQVYKNQGDGFAVIQLLAENYGGSVPTAQQMTKWKGDNNVTFEVVADPQWGVCDPLLNFGFIPTYVLLDQDSVIVKKSLFNVTFHNPIKGLLGIN